MKKAWEIAREGQEKFGGSVKTYFAQALKIAWAQSRKPKKLVRIIRVVGNTILVAVPTAANVLVTDAVYTHLTPFKTNEPANDGNTYDLYWLKAYGKEVLNYMFTKDTRDYFGKIQKRTHDTKLNVYLA